jgi:hypothetical protein
MTETAAGNGADRPDMAGEILRAPYSVDERAALLSWAALAFMRARKDAITEGAEIARTRETAHCG